jgi:hypothetical protein
MAQAGGADAAGLSVPLMARRTPGAVIRGHVSTGT